MNLYATIVKSTDKGCKLSNGIDEVWVPRKGCVDAGNGRVNVADWVVDLKLRDNRQPVDLAALFASKPKGANGESVPDAIRKPAPDASPELFERLDQQSQELRYLRQTVDALGSALRDLVDVLRPSELPAEPSNEKADEPVDAGSLLESLLDKPRVTVNRPEPKPEPERPKDSDESSDPMAAMLAAMKKRQQEQRKR